MRLQNILIRHRVNFKPVRKMICFSCGENKFSIPRQEIKNTSPEIIAGIVLSKLQLNKTVFARKCLIDKVSRIEAENFLNQYHLMGSTSSASRLGLFMDNDLLALATFSKGRKMNRLPNHLRSFELIRFCCKPGITVTGGLSKLIHYFCKIKNAGDVMTYIDKKYSDGESFAKAGFEKTVVVSKDERNIKMIFLPKKISGT